VEKWRPKTTAELVGNNSLVALLKHWLGSWEDVHLHGAAPSVPPSYRGKMKPDDLKKKAVLLSGPPGIGKTSSALIVCRELGFEPVEVNASDARGKSDASALKGVGGKLANAVKEMTTNTAVSYDRQGHRKKLCLIMDEVDGMSAGDRGGVGDLIATIKASKVPIIAICNDKYSTKLKSLRNHTIELDFRKPTVQQIGKRMMEICKAEGLSLNQATLDALIQSASGGDIRLILGQLQMIRLRAKSLTYDQVKSGGMSTAKDLEMSPFEAARKLLTFEAENLSLTDQMELVFQDFDLVPLLVQENYLNHRPKLGQNDAQRLRIIAKAADGFSAGDVATRSIRRDQNWGIMPFAAVMGTVYPATYMRGNRETFGLYPNEPNFPRCVWLPCASAWGWPWCQAAVWTGLAWLLCACCLCSSSTSCRLSCHLRSNTLRLLPLPAAAGSRPGWARTAAATSRSGCWASCTRAC
jgi:replication factor C subunit 1